MADKHLLGRDADRDAAILADGDVSMRLDAECEAAMQQLRSEQQMISQMESLKHVVLNNIRILAPFNRGDRYYREILDLADRDYFFETYQVIAWADIHLRPKRTMEIGTRNGGSLAQLLSLYHRFDEVRVVCFDIWREIGNPREVQRNLQRLRIPTDMIEFVSGDSRRTVPEYKKSHPDCHFDYVLVDGGHEREVAAEDLRNVVDLVAPGGILIFDDIGLESYRLIDVWREFQAGHGEQFHWYEKQWRKGVAWAIRRQQQHFARCRIRLNQPVIELTQQPCVQLVTVHGLGNSVGGGCLEKWAMTALVR